MGWKAAEKLIRHWKILRGDNVMIIRGKDKDETGVVKRVIRSQNRVLVEEKIWKPCKVGVRYLEDGSKVRVSRGIGASGSIIPRPEILKIRTALRPTVAGKIPLWMSYWRRLMTLKQGGGCLTCKGNMSITV